MGRCERFRELIDAGAFLDPSAEGFHEVAEHAAGCPDCARLLAGMREVEGAVRDAFRWADPGPEFTRRVLDAVRPGRGRWVRRLVPWAAAAALILAFVLGEFFAGPPPAPRFRPERVRGAFALADGTPVRSVFPVGDPVMVSGSGSAFEVVHGVGFALRAGTRFRVSPASAPDYTRIELERGGAAVSVKTDAGREKVEVALAGFSILANDADFLVETRTDGDRPGLYVDRGRVVVTFDGGVSAVTQGEHVELAAAVLLSRLHAGEGRLQADLAALDRQCNELREKIARYEEMVATFTARRAARYTELELEQEKLALAMDDAALRKQEERINEAESAVQNLDYVITEHIARMTALRSELPRRLKELQRKRALARKQREECKRGLAVLAGLR